MDSQFQSSFIPKKPLIGSDVQQRHEPVNFFALIGLVIFILSIAAAVGSFFWVRILQKQLVDNQAALKTTREAFDPALIDEIKVVSNRINTAKGILTNHIALSSFFQLVQSVTLKNVRFNSLSYAYDPKGVKVTMTGEADSFVSVALQSDVLNQNKLIINPVIGGLSLLDNGHVSFQFTGDVSPTIVLRENATTTAAAPVTTAPLITTPN